MLSHHPACIPACQRLCPAAQRPSRAAVLVPQVAVRVEVVCVFHPRCCCTCTPQLAKRHEAWGQGLARVKSPVKESLTAAVVEANPPTAVVSFSSNTLCAGLVYELPCSLLGCVGGGVVVDLLLAGCCLPWGARSRCCTRIRTVRNGPVVALGCSVSCALRWRVFCGIHTVG
jgi:hypothetical protein